MKRIATLLFYIIFIGTPATHAEETKDTAPSATKSAEVTAPVEQATADEQTLAGKVASTPAVTAEDPEQKLERLNEEIEKLQEAAQESEKAINKSGLSQTDKAAAIEANRLAKQQVINKEAEIALAQTEAQEETQEKTEEGLFVEKNFADIGSLDRTYASFDVGVTLQPKYDSDGKNEGMKETDFFARLGVDRRFALNHSLALNTVSWVPALHFGGNLAFFSAPAVNCDKFESGTSEADECATAKPKFSNLQFNDFANNLNGSAHLWLHVMQYEDDEFGIGGRYGFKNQEQLGDNGDSVATFYNIGFRYVINDFYNKMNEDGQRYLNGRPKFMIEYSPWSKYEDYAGLKGDVRRSVVLAAYRPSDKLPFYFGFAAIGGEGPDTLAVTFSYGFSTSTIPDFAKSIIGF